MVKEVTSYDELLNHMTNSSRKIVVDFYADWCGPCKTINPTLYELEQKYKNILFLKVNIEKVNTKDISSLPTFRFYMNGKKMSEILGADPNKLKKEVENLNNKN